MLLPKTFGPDRSHEIQKIESQFKGRTVQDDQVFQNQSLQIFGNGFFSIIKVTMKTIIAGSRGITSKDWIHEAIQIFNSEGFTITELVSGAARGVDRTAEDICKDKVPITRFIPDWNGPLKKAAGFARNEEMAKYADALIAIWDGKSNGTKHMVQSARKCTNIKVILLLDISKNKYWITKK